TTSALSVQHSNPLVADANGRFAAWWVSATAGNYKLVLAPANDNDPPAAAIKTEDNIPPVGDQSDFARLSGTNPFTGTCTFSGALVRKDSSGSVSAMSAWLSYQDSAG